ncbi:MAG: hypothetical protein ABEI86_12250, partial [Halobacteriaceae archaeon]
YLLVNVYWSIVLYRDTGVQPFHRNYVKPLIGSTAAFIAISLLYKHMYDTRFISLVFVLILFTIIHLCIIITTSDLEPVEKN